MVPAAGAELGGDGRRQLERATLSRPPAALAPQRAFEVVLAVLDSAAPKAVKMARNDGLMIALVRRHGATLIERIEDEAWKNALLRWLLGGAYWWGSDENTKSRLRSVADEAAWCADRAARDAASGEADFDALPVASSRANGSGRNESRLMSANCRGAIRKKQRRGVSAACRPRRSALPVGRRPPLQVPGRNGFPIVKIGTTNLSYHAKNVLCCGLGKRLDAKRAHPGRGIPLSPL